MTHGTKICVRCGQSGHVSASCKRPPSLLARAIALTLAAMALGMFLAGCSRHTEFGGTSPGLEIHTDYGTGCQYVVNQAGAMWPRMTASGKQYCERGER